MATPHDPDHELRAMLKRLAGGDEKWLLAAAQVVGKARQMTKDLIREETDDAKAHRMVQELMNLEGAASGSGQAGVGLAAGPSAAAGTSANRPATVAELEAVTRQLREEMREVGRSKRPEVHTTSYSHVYHKVDAQGKKRKLATPSISPNAPEYPPNINKDRVDNDEDGTLLPRVMEMLASMPGATRTVVDELPAVEYNDIVFVDTHKRYFLDKKAPDITILQKGCALLPSNVLALLELQVKALDDAHRGKMFIYLQSLLDVCPDRLLAKGALFNGKETQMYQMLRGEDGPLLLEGTHFCLGVDDKWKLLWSYLFNDGSDQPGMHTAQSLALRFGWVPPRLYAREGDNTSEPLLLSRMIAYSQGVHVWEVDQGPNKAVCKHYHNAVRVSSYIRERDALQAIGEAAKDASLAEAASLWPRLLSVNNAQQLLLTQPLAQLMPYITDSALLHLFKGIDFLHNRVQLVYRDFEDKHLGLDGERLCVYDLSTCVKLGSSTSAGYSGTVINASEDVLDALSEEGDVQVEALRQQDLVAAVKTVYGLTHPHRLDAIHDLASQVAERLAGAQDAAARAEVVEAVRSFWSQEWDSSTPLGSKWHGLVRLAHVDAPGAQPYADVIAQLTQELRMYACSR